MGRLWCDQDVASGCVGSGEGLELPRHSATRVGKDTVAVGVVQLQVDVDVCRLLASRVQSVPARVATTPSHE